MFCFFKKRKHERGEDEKKYYHVIEKKWGIRKIFLCVIVYDMEDSNYVISHKYVLQQKHKMQHYVFFFFWSCSFIEKS